MKKIPFLLFALLLIVSVGHSDTHRKEYIDFFDRDHYRRSAKDFNYDEPSQIKKKKENTPVKRDWDFLKFLSYAIVIAAIVFLIYRLILYAYSPDNRKVKNNQVQLNDLEEEPTIESDLEGLLETALKEKNFREAIRIHYLLAIRKLNESKILVYTIDKTNFEYVAEVGGHPVFHTFRHLTIAFEKIWFGDVQADEQKFNSYLINYKTLTEVISSDRPKSTVS